MLVRFVWPSCTFINNDWRIKGIDSFWIECSIEETLKVEPYVTARDESFLRRLQHQEYQRPRCYLVSRHLESVVAMTWSYPISNQWNAYGPFRELPKPLSIETLEELSKVRIPKALRK